MQATTLVSEITSPALRIRRPEPLGQALDRSIEARQRSLWDANHWPETRIGIHEIEHAFVFHNGLVLDHALEPLPFMRDIFGAEQIDRARDFFRTHPEACQPRKGTYTLCARPGGTCYGHILVEIFTSGWLIDSMLASRSPWIISTSKSAVAIYRQLADMLLKPGAELINIGGQGRCFERVHVVDGFARTNHYISPLIRDYAAACIASLPPVDVQDRRIAILRDEQLGRSFDNRTGLVDLLQAHGFELVAPETLSLAEQIRLFRSARVILGAQGSALANIIFCRPGTSILSIAPDLMLDSFFWRLANVFDLDYVEIRARSVASAKSQVTGRPLDGNMVADLDLLDEVLARTLPQPALP
jgi:hypothetical protein